MRHDAERGPVAGASPKGFHQPEPATNDTAEVRQGRLISPLRQLLDKTVANEGCSMKDLTVLATQNDPFRVDTPAGHRDGEWLATTAADLGLGDRRIHLRGLHYMVIGRPKPNGEPYTNTDEDWLWLSGKAGKAARWLGYIPFEQIVDQRNAEPKVRTFEPPDPAAYLSIGVDVTIPDADDLVPEAELDGFDGAQPYKLVMVGEKSSLEDVLAPIATRYKADLYLPTGEISDTLLYRMARVAAADGREMVVFYFSDADPAGWQMPISVARKLQALKAGFCHFEFQVRRVALTPDHVREYGLPSTPLKETERRGDRWTEAMGVEQTEIDALASLQPDLLRRLAREALDPFYDRTLDNRVSDARNRWLEDASAAIGEQLDSANLDQIRQEATERLGELREQIDALNAALRVSADGLELPAVPLIPAAEVADGSAGLPLLASWWGFADQCRRLIDSKAYR